MKKPLAGLLVVCALLACAGCATSHLYIDRSAEVEPQAAPPPDDQRTYRVFLMGDAGAASPDSPTLRLLKAQLAHTGEDGAVVFLGDNIYPSGLPDSASTARPEAEARLRAQLQSVEDFPGRIVFIPGNHDWAQGGSEGRAALARQEAYVEAYLGRGNTFLPDDGFPGPAVVELTDRITLVALDTQWWLEDEPITGDAGEYDLTEPADFLLECEAVFYKNRDQDLLVVGHHPVFSNGTHAGRFPWTEHLTPLPLIGSVTPLYRRFIGYRQDLADARYRLFRRELLQLFGGREDLIYASAHDHSLQYFRKGGRGRFQHYIVSGSGSNASYVAGGHGATFTAQATGFVSLQYYADNSIWMDVWTPEGDGASGRLLFRQRLKDPEPDLRDELLSSVPTAYPDYRDSTVTQAVNPAYARIKKPWSFLLGRHHRDLWATPVTVPVLDVERVAGGLTPLQVGGQSQSVTMRLQGNDGLIYMLRSIDKVAGRYWSLRMQRTFAQTAVQQTQIAMQHPFGALIIPPLSSAAGVFHVNPRLVYVPEDPRLGGFHDGLTGEVVLFEERPDEDMSKVASVGHASNVIGSTKLLREIDADNDHRVDAVAFARARLFDMLIADHDRTTDNFRWAAFEPYEVIPGLKGEARTQGKIYVPVPRDRDLAFLQVDGLLPHLYRLLAAPAWQDFEETYGFLRGLNQKGLPLDRRFTASLTRSDWIAIADSMRAALTDEVIEAAVRAWPEPIFERAGAETIRTLKARRDQLPEVAERYYEVLASVVDVVGSHKHERFEVTRRSDEETDVVVYKTSKEGEVRTELYRRTFYRSETNELRLYGQGGNDQFIIRGDVRKGPRVIAVGGAGNDLFTDSSSVKGRRKKTWFYDTPVGTQLTTGPETRWTLSEDPRVNHYAMDGFTYDLTRPLAFFGSNRDDGIFVGGGVKITRHGFRKEPHAATHQIMGNVAAKTRAFNVRYLGHFVDVWGRWNVGLEAGIYNPNNIRNFYGLGNETTRGEDDARFYQARFSRVLLKPALIRSLDQGVTLHIGPTFEYTNVREDEDRFVGRMQAGVSPNSFDRLFFGGLEALLTVEAVDNRANPRQGVRLNGSADFNAGLRRGDGTYATLASDLALYLSPSLVPQVTLAARVGGAHNVGTFPFFAANTLGGARTLRGYRSTRFAGRTSLYQNLDLRVQLVDFAGYLGYGQAGLLGFVDNGRVWTDGERSRRWHQGYGGGVWSYLFDAVTLAGTLGFSPEDWSFTLNMGFLF